MVLSVTGLQKSFGADEILKDVSFIVEEKEKCALVGTNGAGKTTVFKIIAGEIAKDGGDIFLKKDCALKYMPQDMTVESENTVFDEMLTVFDDVIKLERSLRALEYEMSGKAGAELDLILEKYNNATLSFEEKNGYEYKSRIRGVIKGLGFADDFTDISIGKLSGGEKTRVALGKLLLSQPDLLLLDEPTNHLDIESVQWLEGYLQSYSGALVIISHDRYFLDRVVSKVIEIENKKSKSYNGNYTEFSVKKEIHREIALRAYVNQQKEVKRQEEIIRVFKSYNREKFFKKAQSREKLLMKMERAEKPEDLPEKIRIILEPRVKSGNDVLDAHGLSKSFGDRLLFKNVSFTVKKGEKAALIGPNGIGKTTLFKILVNQSEPDEGKTAMGANVKIGYYEQEREFSDCGKSVFDELHDAFPMLGITEIRNTLAAFMFTGDDVFKNVGSLSGGEAGRVKLAKLMLSDANFLILDEPTNHLDMYSKDILEDALNNYTGTALYISHDRYFINSTADKILELTQNGANTYLGGYDYYLEKKRREDLSEAENMRPADKKTSRSLNGAADKNDKAKAETSRLEKEIINTETEIEALDRELEKEEVYTSAVKSAEIYNQKVSAEKRLEGLYAEWEALG